MDPIKHSFATVELFLQQHGNLPAQEGETREIVVSEAVKNMADKIETGCKSRDLSKIPSPMAVCSVLQYMSDFAKEVEQALDEYHASLDRREHGGIAADKLVKKISTLLGRHYYQGVSRRKLEPNAK